MGEPRTLARIVFSFTAGLFSGTLMVACVAWALDSPAAKTLGIVAALYCVVFVSALVVLLTGEAAP